MKGKRLKVKLANGMLSNALSIELVIIKPLNETFRMLENITAPVVMATKSKKYAANILAHFISVAWTGLCLKKADGIFFEECV